VLLMFVVSSLDWGNAVTGLRWWPYLPNGTLWLAGLRASSPFGQTGANAEQPCRKFFSATSFSQNKYGGIRASHGPSNQALLAVQTIVGTVTRDGSVAQSLPTLCNLAYIHVED
jgi:hypothetical protein